MNARRLVAAIVLALVAFSLAGVADGAFASAQLTLGEQSFDWMEVEDAQAHFRWAAEVRNESALNMRVEVSLDLLAEDCVEKPLAADSQTLTVGGGASEVVTGTVSAADTQNRSPASVRFRVEPHGLSMTATRLDWPEDRKAAPFTWSAEIRNPQPDPARAKVTVEMIGRSCSDRIVHTDAITVEIESGSSSVVRHEGSLSFDRAADVTSFRFRLSPMTPRD